MKAKHVLAQNLFSGKICVTAGTAVTNNSCHFAFDSKLKHQIQFIYSFPPFHKSTNEIATDNPSI